MSTVNLTAPLASIYGYAGDPRGLNAVKEG